MPKVQTQCLHCNKAWTLDVSDNGTQSYFHQACLKSCMITVRSGQIVKIEKR